MIIVECPYCNGENDIFFKFKEEEMPTLIRKGVCDCKCDHCEKIFEVYQGKKKYETRVKVVN